MKITHIGLAVVCLSVYVSSVGAQTSAKVVSTLPKAAQVEHQVINRTMGKYGMLVRPPYRPNPVTPQMLQQPLQINGVSEMARPVQAQGVVTPPVRTPKPVDPAPVQERYISPFADFLKDDWEMPELPKRATQDGFSSGWMDPEKSVGTGIDPLRATAIEFGMPAQVSREILQMQAEGLGIPAENIEYASSSELWLLINLYETMAKSGEIVSRYDEFVQASAPAAESMSLDRWAQQQPDFIRENYVYKEYYEPFNPAVTRLRILIINDNKRYFNPLLDIAAQDSRITVDHVDSVVAAFPALKKSKPTYDVVLTDYCTHAGNALELSMWAYKNGVKVPIVFFSNADGTASYLYSYNLAGRIGLNQPIRSVVNYLSNLVATGKAYPGVGE